MHELSVCRSIVDAISAELEQREIPASQLTGVRVEVGILRQIVPEFLVDAYRIMVMSEDFAGSELEVVECPATGTCSNCGWSGDVVERVFLCPACEEAISKIEGGTELRLASLTMATASV